MARPRTVSDTIPIRIALKEADILEAIADVKGISIRTLFRQILEDWAREQVRSTVVR